MQTKFICKDCFTVLEKYMLQIRGLQLNHFGGFLRDRGNLCISGSVVTQSLHRRGILNIDGSGRFRNKNLFPDFFS